uniref:Uncharacterized protein KIAA1143 homolog isoform X2 n=1 Tax=Saccoglossus kowalevskii TaxID=10224 RepID=A0ABM0MXK0_SACKO|nr:PREDICTED: uncharacterized protein KIAA1143 homolog isoform X2 [Saccoglossus kowalevskii]
MAGRRNIKYVKPNEPTFLSKFKESVGYKEGPTVNTKHMQSFDSDEDDDRPEEDEEKPVVVATKSGDLSQEEAEHYAKSVGKKLTDLGKDDTTIDGKIKYKKPKKRESSEGGLGGTSSKKKKTDEKEDTKKKTKMTQVKNSSLLSFDDDSE